jgi:catechol 2,3-dioxygenase-like lactoylglutathione lyase family enzyme
MIRHCAGFAEIVEDVEAAAEFYRGLGLDVKVENGYGVVELPGTLHFGLWNRADAAESTYGSRDRADTIKLGFALGIEVDSVDEAITTVPAVGEAKTEPWGQRVARFSTPSGTIIEFSETPWARELATNVAAKESAPAQA